ncbi:MAG: pirin family protein [Bacteroidetes bacterium]|nr:pirin family protein [Bacteroidota bacterium]
MENNAIISIKPLDFMWPVQNPFLFFAHHRDDYPAGNDKMGPAASLQGRNIGQDFTVKDGWRMYHGDVVPGFPVHPHRGFETITIVLDGYVDHSDSHGQAGRYGEGDVQWMTAGAGLQHCEMFPLLNQEGANPAELFQIWLNLPAASKFAAPHFKMLWSEDIPIVTKTDKMGKSSVIKVIAGNFEAIKALDPAPDSWAADDGNEVSIWIIKMQENAELELPKASKDIKRYLYFYAGSSIALNTKEIASDNAIELKADEAVRLINGKQSAELILLQAKPINEPVIQYGPFVMNTEAEIRQTFDDYRKTEFGGWPWPSNSMVFPRTKGRFARYRDGREEVRL